jgi:hypothetical protein
MELEQFTYRDLTKTKTRNEMLYNGISSLGTQSGGFGIFNEQARVLTVSGAATIQRELKDNACLDLVELYDACPALEALIK